MASFIGYGVDDLYRVALQHLKDAPIQEGRGEPAKELTHVMLELLEPRNRLVSIRDINPAFAFVEVLWILAGGNNVKYLEFWNPRMKTFAENNGLLWGAYGHRLGCFDFWSYADWPDELLEALYIYHPGPSSQNNNQLLQARDAFIGKPNTRQVVLQIWNAETDLPTDMGDERAKDIPCNLMSHLMLRQGKLEWLQVMRSNDAIWGFPYNVIQFTFLQEIIAGWLHVKPGSFVLLSDSFHTYEKHWQNIPRILQRQPDSGYYHIRFGLTYEKWFETFRELIPCAWDLTTCEPGKELELVHDAFLGSTADITYLTPMIMLAAEAARIKGNTAYAQDVITKTDAYWANAWLRWAAAKGKGEII